MKIIIAVLCLIVVGCAPSLAGKLVDDKGLAVQSESAKVNFVSLTGGPSFVVSTNDAGEFRAPENIPEGEYLVEALVPGYGVQSTKVRIGEGSDIKLVLRKTESVIRSTIGANIDGEVGRGSGGATLMPPKM